MRLIDADALADALFDKRKNYPQWVADTIGGMPTIDVLLKEQEAVVRCKDCKHRPKETPFTTSYGAKVTYIEFPDEKCPCNCTGDEYYSWNPDDYWFCADGEKRDDQ